MFAKVSSQKLRTLAEELSTIGLEEPEEGSEKLPTFARCLAVYMRCELARRQADETDPCAYPIPGFDP